MDTGKFVLKMLPLLIWHMLQSTCWLSDAGVIPNGSAIGIRKSVKFKSFDKVLS
jgi:hypothetical protein